ncbi:MAG TPA: DNA-formamidopyrimidine glycosylase family protein, partial [Vicinamibacteria bacterium]
MPEGDTIWRTARALHAALAGRTVIAFRSSMPAVAAAAERLQVVGRRVEAAEARGKHLLVRFAGGPVLHTHLGMRGSWRLKRAGSARSSPARARAAIETAEAVAVCALAPVVELLSAAQAAAHSALRRLGPDLLAPGFDSGAAGRRLRA